MFLFKLAWYLRPAPRVGEGKASRHLGMRGYGKLTALILVCSMHKYGFEIGSNVFQGNKWGVQYPNLIETDVLWIFMAQNEVI